MEFKSQAGSYDTQLGHILQTVFKVGIKFKLHCKSFKQATNCKNCLYDIDIINIRTVTTSHIKSSITPTSETQTDTALFMTMIFSTTANLHCVSKKVPNFKLSVTLSNLNRFPKFLHCWTACEICYKTHNITHLTLGMLLHYLGISKTQILCKYLADMEKCKQIPFSVHQF